MPYNVDTRDTGYLVDRQMVISDYSTLGIREIAAVATGICSCPYLINNEFGIMIRETFAMEARILTAHHIKQDTEARHISLGVGHTRPVLRAETPGHSLRLHVTARMFTIILSIKENNVYTYIRRLCLQLACHLQQYPHSTGTIIGPENRSIMIFRIGIGIGPRTAVPMRTQQHTLLRLRLIGTNDITSLQRRTVVCSEGHTLRGHLRPEALERLCQPVATCHMRLGIGYTRTEVHLCSRILISTIGIESGHGYRNLRLLDWL